MQMQMPGPQPTPHLTRFTISRPFASVKNSSPLSTSLEYCTDGGGTNAAGRLRPKQGSMVDAAQLACTPRPQRPTYHQHHLAAQPVLKGDGPHRPLQLHVPLAAVQPVGGGGGGEASGHPGRTVSI
jgi:hypothetical protein